MNIQLPVVFQADGNFTGVSKRAGDVSCLYTTTAPPNLLPSYFAAALIKAETISHLRLVQSSTQQIMAIKLYEEAI